MTAQAGFDIAKDFHWLAVTDDRGRQLISHRVDNEPMIIAKAIDELRAVETEHASANQTLSQKAEVRPS